MPCSNFRWIVTQNFLSEHSTWGCAPQTPCEAHSRVGWVGAHLSERWPYTGKVGRWVLFHELGWNLGCDWGVHCYMEVFTQWKNQLQSDKVLLLSVHMLGSDFRLATVVPPQTPTVTSWCYCSQKQETWIISMGKHAAMFVESYNHDLHNRGLCWVQYTEQQERYHTKLW